MKINDLKSENRNLYVLHVNFTFIVTPLLELKHLKIIFHFLNSIILHDWKLLQVINIPLFTDSVRLYKHHARAVAKISVPVYFLNLTQGYFLLIRTSDWILTIQSVILGHINCWINKKQRVQIKKKKTIFEDFIFKIGNDRIVEKIFPGKISHIIYVKPMIFFFHFFFRYNFLYNYFQ